MNYQENEIRWRKGDIVIHDADAKEPGMLMCVIGYTRSGECKTQYVDRSKGRKVYLNDIKYLHEPEAFNIRSYWGKSGYSIDKVQQQWELVKRWNKDYEIFQRVQVGGADGDFVSRTIGLAYMGQHAYGLVPLEGWAHWDLGMVFAITESEATP